MSNAKSKANCFCISWRILLVSTNVSEAGVPEGVNKGASVERRRPKIEEETLVIFGNKDLVLKIDLNATLLLLF